MDIIADRTDIYAHFRVVSSVLLVTFARLIVIELAIVATLSLEVFFAIVTELQFIAMDKLSIVG